MPDSAPAPDLLPLRMLNEYAHCPRLFHLMHVEGRWADNAFTAEGRNVHRRADKLDHVLPDGGKQLRAAHTPWTHCPGARSREPLGSRGSSCYTV